MEDLSPGVAADQVGAQHPGEDRQGTLRRDRDGEDLSPGFDDSHTVAQHPGDSHLRV